MDRMKNQGMIRIHHNENWRLKTDVRYKKTLQLFITNRCNRKCKACFYGDYIGKQDMDRYYAYDQIMKAYELDGIEKVILIGGEPTLHPDLGRIIHFNQKLGLETTVYTNGTHMEPLEGFDYPDVSIRVGVLGFSGFEKDLIDVKTRVPVMVVFMMRADNLAEIWPIIRYSACELDCQGIMLSSIRDLIETQSFFCDTESTISNLDFAKRVQEIVDYPTTNLYRHGIKSIHMCRRTVIEGPGTTNKCRYLNVHVDGSKTICPFDISFGIKDGEGYRLNTRTCNKHHECILQKTVLEAV